MPAPRPLCFPTHWPVWILTTFPKNRNRSQKVHRCTTFTYRSFYHARRKSTKRKHVLSWSYSGTYLTDQFHCSSGSTELWQLVWPPTQTWNHRSSGSRCQTPPTGTQLLQCTSRWCYQVGPRSSGSPACKIQMSKAENYTIHCSNR